VTAHDFQAEKAIVRAHNAAIDAAGVEDVAGAMAVRVAPSYHWRGMHPFDTLEGSDAVATKFWGPLKRAIGPLQRRPDIFMAGQNWVDAFATTWVVEMGHLMGLWETPWLGLGPSNRIAFLRYVEFHRVEDGRIAETATYLDVLGLLNQAGYQPLPPQTGASILSPGPRTHDGLLTDVHDPAEGRATLDLINAMVSDLVGGGVESPGDHMAKFWTSDMCWFGPAGIGASAFYRGYQRGHSQPFEEGLEYVRHNGHQCRIGEGNFGGFFGYPSLTVKNSGGYMGLPASDREADMRIVDLYRREGDKLTENWIFIDILHFLKMQGLDVLARLREYPRL
jgi:hypothetical protein